MNIGIIDADLLANGNHRFPNLCSMKISGWHKSLGDETTLLFDYKEISNYDKVYVSKVFKETEVNDYYLGFDNVVFGGQAFSMIKPLAFQMKLNIIYRIITYMMIG